MPYYQFSQPIQAQANIYLQYGFGRYCSYVGRTSIADRRRGVSALVPFLDRAPGRVIPSELPASFGVVKLLDIAPAFTRIGAYVLRHGVPTGEPSIHCSLINK